MAMLCEAIGVSRSGFCAWLLRPPRDATFSKGYGLDQRWRAPGGIQEIVSVLSRMKRARMRSRCSGTG